VKKVKMAFFAFRGAKSLEWTFCDNINIGRPPVCIGM